MHLDMPMTPPRVWSAIQNEYAQRAEHCDWAVNKKPLGRNHFQGNDISTSAGL
jgi:hypothetical protein